jgi:hypothetical protein
MRQGSLGKVVLVLDWMGGFRQAIKPIPEVARYFRGMAGKEVMDRYGGDWYGPARTVWDRQGSHGQAE